MTPRPVSKKVSKKKPMYVLISYEGQERRETLPDTFEKTATAYEALKRKGGAYIKRA